MQTTINSPKCRECRKYFIRRAHHDTVCQDCYHRGTYGARAQSARAKFDSGKVPPEGYGQHKPTAVHGDWEWWAAKRRRIFPFHERVTDKSPTPALETCACCSRKFTPARSDARFCGPNCKQKAYRTRAAAGTP